MLYTDNRQEEIKVTDEFIALLEEVSIVALKEEEVRHKVQISLLFVDNDEIKQINNETRNIDKETDVLSFPMLTYPKNKVYKDVYFENKFHPMFLDGEELVLGDIVLSLEKAMEQSKEYNHSFKRESAYLLVHSILHLLGYDHMEENEKKVMRKREEEILNIVNISRE